MDLCRLNGLLALFLTALTAAGCHADQDNSGWSLHDRMPADGRLQRLGEVPTGNQYGTQCTPEYFIRAVDNKLLVQRDRSGTDFLVPRDRSIAELLAVDPASGDWEAFEGVPTEWDGSPMIVGGYKRVAGAEWVWGFPEIALYRPDSAAQWREASIGFVKIEEVDGVLFALGAPNQLAACEPEWQTIYYHTLYRHEGGDRWSALREDVAHLSVVDERLFITVASDSGHRLLMSEDSGAHWTPSTYEFYLFPANVTRYGEGFALNTEQNIWLSENGTNWQPIERPEGIRAVSNLRATPFGPMVWGSPRSFFDDSAKLFQLVDGQLTRFAHQPPEFGGFATANGRLAVLSHWKGLQIFDPASETWNAVPLALGQVNCLAHDEEAIYAGTDNNLNRLDGLNGDIWQALPLAGRVNCPIVTRAGLISEIFGHPDAPDATTSYLGRFDAGQWQLLEPPVEFAYIRRDGVRFHCDESGKISRYELDGTAEQIASLGAPPSSCRVFSANQERLVVTHDRKVILVPLDGGEVIDATEGISSLEAGENLWVGDIFDTDAGLFAGRLFGNEVSKWNPDAKRWENMTPPGQLERFEVRAFAASQTTLYAATPGGIWRLDQDDWTRLIDLRDEVFAPRWLDVWNDEILFSTDYFQVYRFDPAGE